MPKPFTLFSVLCLFTLAGCAGTNGGLSTSGGRGEVPERTDLLASEFGETGAAAPQDSSGEDDGEPDGSGSGSSGPEAPEPVITEGSENGACTNDADQAIIAETDDPDYENEAMDTCTTGCFSEVNSSEAFSACYATCLETHGGYSSACASCFGNVVGCQIEYCLSCNDDDECDQCFAENCLEDFEVCSGIEESE